MVHYCERVRRDPLYVSGGTPQTTVNVSGGTPSHVSAGTPRRESSEDRAMLPVWPT